MCSRHKNVLEYLKSMDHKEAMTTPDAEELAKVMKVEFDSMKKTDLLSDPVKLPENDRCIGTKWVFKKKWNLDGHVECFRVRLVAKGFTQIFGLDYMHLWHDLVLYVLCMR